MAAERWDSERVVSVQAMLRVSSEKMAFYHVWVQRVTDLRLVGSEMQCRFKLVCVRYSFALEVSDLSGLNLM